MRPSGFRCLVLCLVFLPVYAQSSAVVDSFWGSTPCDVYIKSVLGVPVTAPCDLLKWQLGLKRETNTFTLEVTYGLSQQGTDGFQHGGTTLRIEGTYELVTTADKHMRYELTAPSIEGQADVVILEQRSFSHPGWSAKIAGRQWWVQLYAE